MVGGRRRAVPVSNGHGLSSRLELYIRWTRQARCPDCLDRGLVGRNGIRPDRRRLIPNSPEIRSIKCLTASLWRDDPARPMNLFSNGSLQQAVKTHPWIRLKSLD